MRSTPQNSFSKTVLLNERTSTVLGSEKFRFGYQGSEKDDEIKGGGNSYTTEFRLLDPRLGRWLTIDPESKKYPWESPYASMNNNPIFYNDIDGDDPQKRMQRKIERFKNKLTKLGITDRSQVDFLIGMKWKESRLSKKISTNITSANGDSEATGSNFSYDYSQNLPDLNIRTVFKGNEVIPENPDKVPAELTKVVSLIVSLQLNVDLIGVINSNGENLGQADPNLALNRALFIRDELVKAGVQLNQINSVTGAKPGTRLVEKVKSPYDYLNRRVIIEIPNSRSVIRRLKNTIDKDSRIIGREEVRQQKKRTRQNSSY